MRGLPTRRSDECDFRQIEAILDPESFRTQAFRVFDASGNLETVHVLSDWRVERPWSDEAGADPFHPSLDGLKRLP